MAHFILYVFRWQLQHLEWIVYHLSDLIFLQNKVILGIPHSEAEIMVSI